MFSIGCYRFYIGFHIYIGLHMCFVSVYMFLYVLHRFVIGFLGIYKLLYVFICFYVFYIGPKMLRRALPSVAAPWRRASAISGPISPSRG